MNQTDTAPTAEQWRQAANVLREQAIKFDRYAEIAQTTEDLRNCGVVSRSGPNGEPLGCGFPNHHSGPHSWASLPTFPQTDSENPDYCQRDHGRSLPRGHEGKCSLTAALCFCPTCEAKR